MVKRMVPHAYRFGHVYIRLVMPEDMPRPENLTKFLVDNTVDAYYQSRDTENWQNDNITDGESKLQERKPVVYTLEYADCIADIVAEATNKQVGNKIIVRDNLRVFQTDTGECRCIYFFGADMPYAVSWQKGAEDYHVWIDKGVEEMLSYDTVFIAMLSLEKHMIQEGAMVLHSAYMCYENSAILFSAPSEVGKSTQASLWEKYRGTRTINGDRSLLIREKDGWYAYGWPVCGSSEICNNETYPIRAIVMLKQAKTNCAYLLKGFQAVREIMEQITINSWDSNFQIQVMDNLEQLIEEVPVYRLECDISEQAVECLEQMLAMREE